MNALQVKMNKRDKAIQQKKKEEGIPIFNSDGKIKKEKKKMPKKMIASIIAVGTILSLIYIPGLFMNKEEDNAFVLQPDIMGIKKSSEAAQNAPDEDFDGDGLINSLESKYNTSIRRPDSDGDGVCDYAEIFITDTDPNKADKSLYDAVLKKEGSEKLMEPYKIYNVVLWPDNMSSRVYGGLVRTRQGYRFCNYTGWAQFPEGAYAYKVKDGVHVPLKYKKVENAWYIDDDSEVVLTDKPLETIHYFTVLNAVSAYIPDNFAGRMLSAILPDRGFITCRKMTKIDTWTNVNNIVTAPIVSIHFDVDDLSRYGKNNNTLEDLAKVYASIDEGSSVMVSLNSSEYGEVIAEIYGYTLDGELLLADPGTLQTVGTLKINERSGRYMDKDGEITYREWYEFKGIGFDSAKNFDRINFFAAAVEGNVFETKKEDINISEEKASVYNYKDDITSETDITSSKETTETIINNEEQGYVAAG